MLKATLFVHGLAEQICVSRVHNLFIGELPLQTIGASGLAGRKKRDIDPRSMGFEARAGAVLKSATEE